MTLGWGVRMRSDGDATSLYDLISESKVIGNIREKKEDLSSK